MYCGGRLLDDDDDGGGWVCSLVSLVVVRNVEDFFMLNRGTRGEDNQLCHVAK